MNRKQYGCTIKCWLYLYNVISTQQELVLLDEVTFPLNTVRCHYNVINFLTNIHKRHPIARPLGRGMGVFVDLAADWYCASVPVIIYVISYNIGPCYNCTWLYRTVNHRLINQSTSTYKLHRNITCKHHFKYCSNCILLNLKNWSNLPAAHW